MYIYARAYICVYICATCKYAHSCLSMYSCGFSYTGRQQHATICVYVHLPLYIYMCVHRCMYTHRSSQGHMHRCTPVPAYIPSRSHILCFTLLGVYAYWDFVSCNGSVFRPCSCQLLLQFSRLVTTCYRDYYCHTSVVTPLNLLRLLIIAETRGRSTSNVPYCCPFCWLARAKWPTPWHPGHFRCEVLRGAAGCVGVALQRTRKASRGILRV